MVGERAPLGAFRIALMSAVAACAIAGGASAAPLPYAGLTWDTDRYPPDTVEVLPSYLGRNDVLHIELGPNGSYTTRNGLGQGFSFYQYQGISAQSGLPGGMKAFYQFDLYIPAAWSVPVPDATTDINGTYTANGTPTNTNVDISMWAEIPANQPPGNGAYPTWGYLNDHAYSGGPPDLWSYDGDTGAVTQQSGGTVNYDNWNTLRMEYRDTEILFLVNGTVVGSHTWSSSDITLAGDPNNTFKTLFIQAFHFEDYDGYSAALEAFYNFYISELHFGVLVNSAQTLSTSIAGAAEVENGGVLTVTGGTTIGDYALIRSGGTMVGGTVGTPYIVDGNVTNNGILGGNVNITGNLSGTGRIAPGNSPGIINVAGNYSQATATMEANLALAPVAGTTHDLVDIVGNAAGTTSVTVAQLNAAGTGIATTGNGIKLFEVGGTASASSFVLAAPVFSGGYQYVLQYLPNFSGPDDGFFLQSQVRQDLFGHAALISGGQAMTRGCLRGDDRLPDRPSGKSKGRGWVSYHTGTFETGADSGIEMEQDYSCVTGGVDFLAGDGMYLGLAGGLGQADADVTTLSGIATLEGDMVAVEATASIERAHFFFNLSAGFAQTDWAFDGTVLGLADTSSSGFIASALAGKTWGLSSSLALSLMAGVNYDDVSCDDNCLVAGTTEDSGIFEGKATARLEGTWGNVRPYVAVSFSDDFNDGTTVSIGPAVVAVNTNDSLLSLDGGLKAYVASNIAVFADVGYSESLSKDVDGFKGGVGAKFFW